LENIQKVEFFIFQGIFRKYPELIPENIPENIRKISRNWNFSETGIFQKLEFFRKYPETGENIHKTRNEI